MATTARGDLDSRHPVLRDQPARVALRLLATKFGIVDQKSPPHRRSRLEDLQLFATLEISSGQLFPEPGSAESGW